MVLIGRELVGYVPADRNVPVLRLLSGGRRPLTVRAELTGGWHRPAAGWGEPSSGSIGVRLRMDPAMEAFHPDRHPFIGTGAPVALKVRPQAMDSAAGLIGADPILGHIDHREGVVMAGIDGMWIGQVSPARTPAYIPLIERLRSAGIPLRAWVTATAGAKNPLVKVHLPHEDRVTAYLEADS